MAAALFFTVNTDGKESLTEITKIIAEFVRQSLLGDGICVVYVPHTTCSVTINENTDPDVKRDLLFALNRAVPDSGFYHMEGNSNAHAKAAMLGFSQTIPVESGRLMLGTWQGIFLGEFDGPRTRTVYVKCIAG